MKKVSAYTKRVKVTERTARCILWAAAGLTIIILVLIIGFILFRGFVSTKIADYPFLSGGGSEVSLDPYGRQKIAFIVNRGVRISEMTMQEILQIYAGEMRVWKFSGQDLDTRPFSLSEAVIEGGTMAKKLETCIEEYSAKHLFLDGDDEVINRVSDTAGAIGFIRYESLDRVKGKKVKVLTVRSISLVGHPQIYAIVDNIRLGPVTPENVQSIIAGEITNWKELGGIDLPVSFISFDGNSYITHEIMKLTRQTQVIAADNGTSDGSTSEEYFDLIRTNPGSVGYALYLDIPSDLRESILQIRRHETARNINWHFLVEDPARSGQVGGVRSIILNTLFMIMLTLAFAAPIGIGAAVYLIEYSRQNPVVRVLRFFTETLAGIPSIIFGLFGYIVFAMVLKWGMGLLSGTLTLTIMVLPTLIRTTEEALKAVPLSFREGSLALGATQWQTITRVVLPAASPGILTGIILSIGRAVGETAAVLFTLGSSYTLARDLFSSARVLSLHLYFLVTEGLSIDRAFATATILIVIVLIVNLTTSHLIGRMNKYGRK